MDLTRYIQEAAQKNPGAFADVAIPLEDKYYKQAQKMVRVIHHLLQDPVFQKRALEGLSPMAIHDQGMRSVFSCCDYHITGDSLRLIEMNTHGSGAIATAAWQGVLKTRYKDKKWIFPDEGSVLGSYWEALESEWRLFTNSKGRPLKHIAIVDDDPEQQAYYSEFVIAQAALQERGYAVSILNADGLQSLEGVDLVYNRCVDFYFEEARHAALKNALLSDQCCFSSSPRIHALMAKKNILVYLSEITRGEWKELKISDEDRSLLNATVPETRFLHSMDLAEAWATRKKWVFKPNEGYQAKGVYRGKSLSRTHFDKLDVSDYMAQEFIPPSETEDGLRVELRFYHYAEQIQYGVARLYTGQVANFRDPRGGAAALYFKK